MEANAVSVRGQQADVRQGGGDVLGVVTVVNAPARLKRRVRNDRLGREDAQVQPTLAVARVEELEAQFDGPGDRVLALALVADVERGDALALELGRDGRDGPRDVVVFERDLLVDRLAAQLEQERHLADLLGQDVEGPGIRECPIGLGKLVPQELDRLPARHAIDGHAPGADIGHDRGIPGREQAGTLRGPLEKMA